MVHVMMNVLMILIAQTEIFVVNLEHDPAIPETIVFTHRFKLMFRNDSKYRDLKGCCP